jgi:hypothetical protein
MRLLKTTEPPAEARRTKNEQRSRNADARSSMVCFSLERNLQKLDRPKVRPSANPCLLHLSRRGGRRRSMKKPAIVFPECFAPDIQVTVASRRADFFTQRYSAVRLRGSRQRAPPHGSIETDTSCRARHACAVARQGGCRSDRDGAHPRAQKQPTSSVVDTRRAKLIQGGNS